MDNPDDEQQQFPSLNGSRRPGGLGLLAFRAPEDDLPPIPSPSSSPEATTPGEGTPLEQDGPSPSADAWPTDELPDEDESSTISSPGSSAEDTPPPVTKAALKRTFRKGVLLTTGTLSKFAAKTQGQQMVGLYRADVEDAEAIGDPLAEMAHRRGGLVGKTLSPDAQNAVEAAMGLGSYIAKQFALAQQALKIDAELAGLPPADGPVDV